MNDSNRDMKEYIKSWGLPDCLKDCSSEYEYKFSPHGIINTNEAEEYLYDDRNFKFSIWNPPTGLALFTMDFFKTPIQYSSKNPFIILELIYVHLPEWRKNGIASYYIKKLIQYAIEEKMDCIKVTPIADAVNFKNFDLSNALSQQELVDYYKKWDSPEMPFEVVL
jgi:GNAT superfamily N-acetyltransferase